MGQDGRHACRRPSRFFSTLSFAAHSSAIDPGGGICEGRSDVPMKFPVIIAVFAVSLGVSFAAGGYFAPGIFRKGLFETIFSAPNPLTQPTGNSTPAVAINTGNVTPQPSAPAPGDLPSILKETNSYHLLRDLAVYADSLSAADMSQAVEKVQSLSGNENRHQALAILVGRWVELDPKAALAAPLCPSGIRW